MRLVRGGVAPGPGECVGFIVIGDGVSGEKVMAALLKRFDDGKALLMPQDRPALGLEGSVALASQLVGRWGKDVLIVIDREHFDEGLLDNLLGMYFSEHGVKQRSNGFWRIEAVRGRRGASLYMAIMGAEKAREEVDAALIYEVFGIGVEPTREAIRRFLSERDVSIYELVSGAGEGGLKRAFPEALVELLKEWGRDPHGQPVGGRPRMSK